MGRVVLLSFRNNEIAESFVRTMLRATDEELTQEEIFSLVRGLGTIVAAGGKVEAIVARPTIACKCKHKGKPPRWKKSQRFGWWICPNCNRPSPYAGCFRIKNAIIGMGGNNLLHELVASKETHDANPSDVPNVSDDVGTTAGADSEIPVQ